MNKRALRKLLIENNLKSPDIFTVILTADDRIEACSIVEYYFDIVGKPFLFTNYDSWTRSLSPPTELYFIFDHKRQMMRFIRQLKKEHPNTTLIF